MKAEQEKVTIRAWNVKDSEGVISPLGWSVQIGQVQHGYFAVGDYDEPVLAHRAAQALVDSLNASPWVSPFAVHRKIIMADYGTAAKIRRIVLSLYNGQAFPVDLSDVAGMDKVHFQIVLDLLTSYHQLGENDKVHMRLAEEIKREFHQPAEDSAVSVDPRFADYQGMRDTIDRADSVREFQEGPDFEGVSYE